MYLCCQYTPQNYECTTLMYRYKDGQPQHYTITLGLFCYLP